MSRKKFSLSAWIASLGGALLGAAIIAPENWTLDSSTDRILWAGAFFLVVFFCGFLGLQLALQLSRKYKVERPRGWVVSMLLAGALLFCSGACGQALFMYSREAITIPAEVDMVLLLDASGSMDSAGYDRPRTEAGCQFVDSLDEKNRLQAISFASTVLNNTQLLVTDDAGRETLKQFIYGIDSIGMTNFNDPLYEALDTLEDEGREKCNHAVILLTDGAGDIDQNVIDEYLDTDIKVFSIRIDNSPVLDYQAQALADFAAATGGFDAQLIPNADGSINTADLLTAFQNAFQATSETRLKMSEDLLVCTENTTLWQFIVRAVTLMICSAIFGFGYFGRINVKSLSLHAIVGFTLAVLISILGNAGYSACVFLLCLLMAAAYVTLNLDAGDEINV